MFQSLKAFLSIIALYGKGGHWMTIEDFNKKTKLLLAMILQDLIKYRELS